MDNGIKIEYKKIFLIVLVTILLLLCLSYLFYINLNKDTSKTVEAVVKYSGDDYVIVTDENDDEYMLELDGEYNVGDKLFLKLDDINDKKDPIEAEVKDIKVISRVVEFTIEDKGNNSKENNTSNSTSNNKSSNSNENDTSSIDSSNNDTVGSEADVVNYFKSLDSSLQKTLDNLFKSKFADNKFKEIQINNVDPTVGKEFFIKCMVAVLVAVLLMIVYIAFRFKKVGGWLAGSTAIVALIHDVIMIYGTFVILKMPVNDFFIAGALLILGYSVNDTIVIYDRIRENKKKYGSKMKFDELVNLSINQSFIRTINTTVTTVLSIVVVLVVAYLNGVNSIISFMLPIMIGMISGTYSTICIAGPLWVILKNKKKSKKVQKFLSEEN